MSEVYYEVYIDSDNYKEKQGFSNNIESKRVFIGYDLKQALFIYDKYCKKAYSQSRERRGCWRFNVHILKYQNDSAYTFKYKNFFTDRWKQEYTEDYRNYLLEERDA